MIGYVFLLAICLVATPTSGTMTLNCQKAFPTSTLTKNYNETIAHAIHSMTVAGLRVFSSKASANNFVPTVNQDLSQEQTVLDHAPEHALGHDFSTLTMNIIDNILSTLGNSMDGLGSHWSPVERVAHVFHMWDLWYRIKESAWPRVQKTPPTDEMCTCLASVEFNGIKDAVQWVANHYKTGTPITLLNRPIPKLTDAAAWGVWKQRLLHYYTPEALQDAAMYLHCVSQFW
ncbi:uncharacterized protein LOC127878242 [Dreissena polymorpha]|uniref:Uncharacterized protein n=1 Tax=Dreissena polymorpha TaxID=45954 RepID=A0A9D4RTJ9_DREPO|nr:uncharacterized protein LOC127878242 [Dreissena polymorpha]KAH3880529.1 hypothetical protein DPMN_004445 [Dreissena polymorpha]